MKSRSYNPEASIKHKGHDPKKFDRSYKKINHQLSSPKDTPRHSSLLHEKKETLQAEEANYSHEAEQVQSHRQDKSQEHDKRQEHNQDHENHNGFFQESSEESSAESETSGGVNEELIKEFEKNPRTAIDAMELIYHVWEKDELENVFELFDEAKKANEKVRIKHDDGNLVFEHNDVEVKVKLDKNLFHHIYSYCHGPIDSVGKLNYHQRNVGPVDSPEEIIYLTDTPGPVDTIMELLYHTRNEGQVDTPFEWYRLVRNSGDISSRDEILYHNQNLGPQDTKGEYRRRNKNVGPVDTPGERGFYGIDKENRNPNQADNIGPIDTQAEVNTRGKSTAPPAPNPFKTKPY